MESILLCEILSRSRSLRFNKSSMQMCVIRLWVKSIVLRFINDFNFDPVSCCCFPESGVRLYRWSGLIQVSCKLVNTLNPIFKWRIEIGSLSGIANIWFPRRSRISSWEFENAPRSITCNLLVSPLLQPFMISRFSWPAVFNAWAGNARIRKQLRSVFRVERPILYFHFFKFWFLAKILIFDQNVDFWSKFWFLKKISIFDQNFDFNQILIFDQIFILDQYFNYWQKFPFLIKILIFEESFDFWPKILIFDQNLAD